MILGKRLGLSCCCFLDWSECHCHVPSIFQDGGALRFQVSDHLEATHKDVLGAVVGRLGEREVRCLTQTRRGYIR